MTERDDELRWFAEHIIAGEFKSILIVMVDDDDMIHTFHPGPSMTSIGLAEWAAFYIKNHVLNGDE